MVLLTHAPSDEDVREVVVSTTDPDQTEHSMYVQQRLFQMASRDVEFRYKELPVFIKEEFVLSFCYIPL